MPDFVAWQRWLIGLATAFVFTLSLPNILPPAWLDILPSWASSLRMQFAIDLRGGSRLVVKLTEIEAGASPDSATIDKMMVTIGQRLDHAGDAFADYYLARQGKDYIRVEVPALFDVSLLKNFVTVTARLSLYPLFQEANADDVIAVRVDLPENTLIFYDHDADPPLPYLVRAQPLLSSDMMQEVFVRQDEAGNSAHIELKSRQAVAFPAHSQLVAVLDGEVIGLARLGSENQFILSHLLPDFAENLRIVLNSGPLPAAAEVMEERTIGTDLGEGLAAAGQSAALGALIVVALFMIACYGVMGLIANIALALNLALLASILGLIGWPLSLAGFAGMVLTIGVSVDALILIFERMREEWRAGVALHPSLEAGFLRARSTILDANITTLLGAMMLFLFGVGPISGFAMTVTIGICISLFTNLFYARWLIKLWLHYFKPRALPIRLLRLVPASTTIAFMRARKFCLNLAAVISLLALAFISSAGLHYGIDFAGGSLAVLKPHAGQANATDIATRALELNIGAVRVEPAEQGTGVYLTIPSQNMGEAAEQSVALKLRGEFDEDYLLERVDVVGPAIAARSSQLSLWAVFLSLLVIFLYVWRRFNWKFAVGALLTTIHDIVALLLIFSLMQWEFNLWSIAALLAIIGYSLNDTIVVYDRIRSLLAQFSQIQGQAFNMAKLVDLGINRTLSRTILTSLATLLAHIPLYYYGGADMRNFASILLIGIIIGTASSILIAGPLLAILGLKQEKKVEKWEKA